MATYQLYVVDFPQPNRLTHPMNLGFFFEEGKVVGRIAVSWGMTKMAHNILRHDHTKPLELVFSIHGQPLRLEVRKAFFSNIDLTENLNMVEISQDLRACGLGDLDQKAIE